MYTISEGVALRAGVLPVRRNLASADYTRRYTVDSLKEVLAMHLKAAHPQVRPGLHAYPWHNNTMLNFGIEPTLSGKLAKLFPTGMHEQVVFASIIHDLSPQALGKLFLIMWPEGIDNYPMPPTKITNPLWLVVYNALASAWRTEAQTEGAPPPILTEYYEYYAPQADNTISL